MKPKSTQPKKERAYLYILSHPEGVTENEILRNVGLSSGRNYPTELERLHGAHFKRIREPNPDGIGAHYRYKIASKKAAEAILKAINSIRKRRGESSLKQPFEAQLLAPFK